MYPPPHVLLLLMSLPYKRHHRHFCHHGCGTCTALLPPRLRYLHSTSATMAAVLAPTANRTTPTGRKLRLLSVTQPCGTEHTARITRLSSQEAIGLSGSCTHDDPFSSHSETAVHMSVTEAGLALNSQPSYRQQRRPARQMCWRAWP